MKPVVLETLIPLDRIQISLIFFLSEPYAFCCTLSPRRLELFFVLFFLFKACVHHQIVHDSVEHQYATLL